MIDLSLFSFMLFWFVLYTGNSSVVLLVRRRWWDASWLLFVPQPSGRCSLPSSHLQVCLVEHPMIVSLPQSHYSFSLPPYPFDTYYKWGFAGGTVSQTTKHFMPVAMEFLLRISLLQSAAPVHVWLALLTLGLQCQSSCQASSVFPWRKAVELCTCAYLEYLKQFCCSSKYYGIHQTLFPCIFDRNNYVNWLFCAFF